jgi:hypothetical protein
MERDAIIVKIKPGTMNRAKALVAQGPPFDPETLELERHTVFVSDDHVVFVFEGGRADALVRAASGAAGAAAFAAWEPILDGVPSLAKEEYRWERAEDPAWAGGWGE